MAARAAMRRALRVLRRDGPRATAARALQRGRVLVYLSDVHVWYQLDLGAERPRRELPPEVRLIQASLELAPRVEELGQNPDTARRRHADGDTLWFALDGDELLFSCWTFRKRTPILAAPNGSLELPPDVACLEDSVTSPAARGRGIAPGSWTAIADLLAAEGWTAMITTVAVENAPSRKAVTKAGFREIGVMRFTRVGPRRRTSMEPAGDGLGAELAARLTGAQAPAGRTS